MANEKIMSGLIFLDIAIGEEISTVDGEYYQGYEAVKKNRQITET